MGQGVQGKVDSVLRGWSGLEPREGQATARIPCTQGPVVRGVAVEGRCLHGGRKPCGRRVNFRGGAQYPKGGQAALVPKEEVEWRETGFDGQDINGGAHEAVGCRSLDLVPEDGELPRHVDGGGEGVRAIAEDGEGSEGSVFFFFFFLLYHIFVVKVQEIAWSASYGENKTQYPKQTKKGNLRQQKIFSWGPYRSQAHIQARN